MSDKGAKSGRKREVVAIEAGERDGGGALQRVTQQGRGSEPLAAGAQHVGGADIARPYRADVAQARQMREDDAERNRAKQIAETQRERAGRGQPIGALEHGQTLSANVPVFMPREDRPERLPLVRAGGNVSLPAS